MLSTKLEKIRELAKLAKLVKQAHGILSVKPGKSKREIKSKSESKSESKNTHELRKLFDDVLEISTLKEFEQMYEELYGESRLLINVLTLGDVEICQWIIARTIRTRELNSIMEKVTLCELPMKIILLLVHHAEDKCTSYELLWKEFYRFNDLKKFKQFLSSMARSDMYIQWKDFQSLVLEKPRWMTDTTCGSSDSETSGSDGDRSDGDRSDEEKEEDTFGLMTESSFFEVAIKYIKEVDARHVKKWMQELRNEERERLEMSFHDTFEPCRAETKASEVVKQIIEETPLLAAMLEDRGLLMLTKSDIKENIIDYTSFEDSLKSISAFNIDTLLAKTLHSTDTTLSRGIIVLVREADKQPEALLMYERFDDSVLISSLSVQEKLRNGGMGKILLGTFLILEKRLGASWCVVEAAQKAEHFYERFGMQNFKCHKDLRSRDAHDSRENKVYGLCMEHGYTHALNLSKVEENDFLLNMLHDIPVPVKEWRKRPLSLTHEGDLDDDDDRKVMRKIAKTVREGIEGTFSPKTRFFIGHGYCANSQESATALLLLGG